ncbi:MAG: hypothetical protein M3P39_10525, partial [Actinomycetota bacterium]|nr:hypothetical protein [Actinomycetota bacterium]
MTKTMNQVSRPVRFALVATLVLAVAWFTVLRAKVGEAEVPAAAVPAAAPVPAPVPVPAAVPAA